jgi:hypothetical protein
MTLAERLWVEHLGRRIAQRCRRECDAAIQRASARLRQQHVGSVPRGRTRRVDRPRLRGHSRLRVERMRGYCRGWLVRRDDDEGWTAK